MCVPSVGAATSVWAATARGLEAHGGACPADCAVDRAEQYATDPANAARLWRSSDGMAAVAEAQTFGMASSPVTPPSTGTVIPLT